VTHGPYIYIDRRHLAGAGTRNGQLVTLPPELGYVPPDDCYGYCQTNIERPTQVSNVEEHTPSFSLQYFINILKINTF
jgi:hypothetical protein